MLKLRSGMKRQQRAYLAWVWQVRSTVVHNPLNRYGVGVAQVMRVGERQERGWYGNRQRWNRGGTWGTKEGLQGALLIRRELGGWRRFGDRRRRFKESSDFTGRALLGMRSKG